MGRCFRYGNTRRHRIAARPVRLRTCTPLLDRYCAQVLRSARPDFAKLAEEQGSKPNGNSNYRLGQTQGAEANGRLTAGVPGRALDGACRGTRRLTRLASASFGPGADLGPNGRHGTGGPRRQRPRGHREGFLPVGGGIRLVARRGAVAPDSEYECESTRAEVMGPE
jgi:hypothetical protein